MDLDAKRPRNMCRVTPALISASPADGRGWHHSATTVSPLQGRREGGDGEGFFHQVAAHACVHQLRHLQQLDKLPRVASKHAFSARREHAKKYVSGGCAKERRFAAEFSSHDYSCTSANRKTMCTFVVYHEQEQQQWCRTQPLESLCACVWCVLTRGLVL